MATGQAKHLEVEFFDRHATAGTEYNVFTEATNGRLIRACLDRCGLKGGDRVLDLGCGSGVFSSRLAKQGLSVTGVDISPKLIEIGCKLYPEVKLEVGDAEALAFEDGAFDAVFLGGVIHHFPDPVKMAKEVARVVKPTGSFYAFDPNRLNPFMYLYRDRSSPFYSPVGVTPNERPVLVKEVVKTFADAGFDVKTDYMSVQYTYVASGKVRWLLPAYNFIDTALFYPSFLKRFRPFLLTWGRKKAPANPEAAD